MTRQDPLKKKVRKGAKKFTYLGTGKKRGRISKATKVVLRTKHRSIFRCKTTKII